MVTNDVQGWSYYGLSTVCVAIRSYYANSMLMDGGTQVRGVSMIKLRNLRNTKINLKKNKNK